MDDTQEKIKIMQAFVDGKQIEVCFEWEDTPEWQDTIDPQWNWLDFDYRIKETNIIFPIWCESISKLHKPFTVKFDSLHSGIVVESSYYIRPVGERDCAFVDCTDINYWKQVEEPGIK